MGEQTFAIGTAERVVDLWCEPLGFTDDGWERFVVINGGWQGGYKDGQLRVDGDLSSKACSVVWRGVVPEPHDLDYNEAIPWIEGQLRGG